MKNLVLGLILVAVLFSSSRLWSQVPDLGTAAHFVLFTSAGAVGNTGISNVIGDVGSDVGAITGFEALSGTIYNNDATTGQARIDVLSAYNQLFNTPATSTAHTPAFGNGETLAAGVYSITGAASVLGALTLDAQGNPNAIFIFKTGGALTTAASTTIYLVNGAIADNIYWIAEGAISMGASTAIAGTFIANNGAVDMGAGSTLEGRLLSTAGAVSVYGTHAFIPANSVLSMDFLSLSANCEGADTRLTWTVSNLNINDITIEVSKDGSHWTRLIKIKEGDKVWLQHAFLFTDHSISSPSFYRLLQENSIGKNEYGSIVRVVPCTIKNDNRLSIYPNPSTGIFHLAFSGRPTENYSTTIVNINGRVVYLSAGISKYIDVSHLPVGAYVVSVKSASSQISYTLMKL